MDTQTYIDQLKDDILRQCTPQSIWIYSQKASPSGQLTSVKLCVVVPGDHLEDPEDVEQSLYLNTESDLPFDVLVYTRQEWNALLEDKGSFASQIRSTGRLLYEAD